MNLRRPIIVTNVAWLRSCAEVRAAIELSFGVVSGVGVGPVIHVLDGGSRAPKGRGYLGDFRHLHSHWFEWAELRIFRTEMSSTPTWKVDDISERTIYRWNLRFIGFLGFSQVQDRCWVLREICKNVTVDTKNWTFRCMVTALLHHESWYSCCSLHVWDNFADEFARTLNAKKSKCSICRLRAGIR